MNKDIKFVSLDSALERRLIEELEKGTLNSEKAIELLDGLKALQQGAIRSLVISNDDEISENTKNINGDIKVGDLEIRLKSRRVLLGSVDVSLTPKEFDILYFLAENRGEVFTKEQIYNAVWSDEYMLDDSNIMAFIRKLRKKIEPNPDAPKYILTIWGIGYKFNDYEKLTALYDEKIDFTEVNGILTQERKRCEKIIKTMLEV